MIEEVFYSCNENYDKLQWNMKTCNQLEKQISADHWPTYNSPWFYLLLFIYSKRHNGWFYKLIAYQISNIWSAWVLLPVFSTFIATQCCLCRNVFILFSYTENAFVGTQEQSFNAISPRSKLSCRVCGNHVVAKFAHDFRQGANLIQSAYKTALGFTSH